MTKDIFNSIKSLSSSLIAEEARERGIKVNHINKYQKKMAFLELSYRKHYEYIVAQDSSKTSYAAYYAQKNKALTKSLLSRAKINVTKGKLFFKENICEMSEFLDKIKYPIVVKPHDGGHGDQVFVGIKDKSSCEEIVKNIFKKRDYVLIEEMFFGTEYRILATRNKVVAVTNRVPANIIGDGVHTIKELINIKNSDPRRGDDHDKALIKIKIDSDVLRNLKKQKLKLGSIVKNEKTVFLRKISNISAGGDSIDVTDIVHPDIKKIAIKAIKAIPGLIYGGVDFMTDKDISKKPTIKSYIIIEINSSPGIFIHHCPYRRKPKNVAKEIIDILFPEIKRKYIGKTNG